MKIGFEQFRCFGERQSADIKPLTLLVGENSTGKSTFMSGLRFILDFTSGRVDSSFNKDPFFLGGYRDIAHYRGGKYGRAPSFSISISETFAITEKRNTEPELFERARQRSQKTIELKLTFSDEDGEPTITNYAIRIGKKSISIGVENEEISAIVQDDTDGFEHSLGKNVSRRIPLMRGDYLALDYMLRELSFFRDKPNKISDSDAKAANIVEEIWQLFRKLTIRGRSEVLALAPVRTRPQRNYDPTQLDQSSEGDQLIGKLGRLARTNKKSWSKLKDQLEAFGQETGLFESISIRKLGAAESNPFQIYVKKSGREANIIDVGYGVSQILPLFIILSEVRHRTTMLVQQPEVHLHPSAQAALGTVFSKACASGSGPNLIVETHSDFIVDRVRNAVRKGDLRSKDVQILYFEKEKYNSSISTISIGEDGNLINAPDSYRDFFLRESFSLMGF
ncbi:MAG: AAA family ATPase [Henriciella sp.]|uniref:AAA family ATPase n=1 Tax=Henriciella sp. TaxID=1968823 RepID=UPI0032F07E19